MSFITIAGWAADGKSNNYQLKAALVVDMDSGKVLYEQNADKPIQPASLTKILALYLINEDLRAGKVRLTDPVKVSSRAVKTNGSKMLRLEGEKVSLNNLIKGMAILSANDATVALAEHLGGSVGSFVARMNAKAKELGMKNSFFVNPHGLPDSHQYTTARDMYILSYQYLQRFPDCLNIHSIQYFTYNNVIHHNRNNLLWEDPAVDGLKTGYVYASGFHLVATARRDDARLIAVVLGAKNPQIRARQTKKLLDDGFYLLGGKRPNSLIGA